MLPEEPEKLEPALGRWLKDQLQKRRNTVRFLLPRAGLQMRAQARHRQSQCVDGVADEVNQAALWQSLTCEGDQRACPAVAERWRLRRTVRVPGPRHGSGLQRSFPPGFGDEVFEQAKHEATIARNHLSAARWAQASPVAIEQFAAQRLLQAT